MQLYNQQNPIDEEVLEQICGILKSLGDPTRLKITLALSNQKELSFGKIKKQLKIANSSVLAHHLIALQKNNLVENFYEKTDSEEYSHYATTEHAKKIVQFVLDIVVQEYLKEPVMSATDSRDRSKPTHTDYEGKKVYDYVLLFTKITGIVDPVVISERLGISLTIVKPIIEGFTSNPFESLKEYAEFAQKEEDKKKKQKSNKIKSINRISNKNRKTSKRLKSKNHGNAIRGKI